MNQSSIRSCRGGGILILFLTLAWEVRIDKLLKFVNHMRLQLVPLISILFSLRLCLLLEEISNTLNPRNEESDNRTCRSSFIVFFTGCFCPIYFPGRFSKWYSRHLDCN